MIGRYTLEGLIGEGGFSAVYRARRVDDKGQPIGLAAVKILDAREGEAAERFLKEAQIIGQLHSPYTVRLYDTGVTDEGDLYLAMEYLQGESLSRRIRRQGTVPWAQALEFVGQVCRSLHEAHELGIIHRDIKGDNIFLHHVAGDVVARVLDFGVAHLEKSATQLTGDHTLIGTPRCMSPEQIKGGKVDRRSDLYALGVVLYRMLTGEPPFSADTPYALFFMHVYEPPVHPRELGLDLPEGVNDLVLRLLSKNPEGRPESALALFRECKALMANKGALGAHGAVGRTVTEMPTFRPGLPAESEEATISELDVPTALSQPSGSFDGATVNDDSMPFEHTSVDIRPDGLDDQTPMTISEVVNPFEQRSPRFGWLWKGGLTLVALLGMMWWAWPTRPSTQPSTRSAAGPAKEIPANQQPPQLLVRPDATLARIPAPKALAQADAGVAPVAPPDASLTEPAAAQKAAPPKTAAPKHTAPKRIAPKNTASSSRRSTSKRRRRTQKSNLELPKGVGVPSLP
ncbi:MAG: serine/threonine protein kinase [Bradymonadia bacterium]